MALSRTGIGLEVLLDAGRTFIHQRLHDLKQARAKRTVYRTTYYELSKLTDRDLADLGIPRSNIRRLAWEAAYGS